MGLKSISSGPPVVVNTPDVEVLAPLFLTEYGPILPELNETPEYDVWRVLLYTVVSISVPAEAQFASIKNWRFPGS